MARIEASDLIESNTYTQDSSGRKATRSFLVVEVSGNAYDKLYQAALKCPAYGTPHPSIPNIFVSNISASPVAEQSTQVIVLVTYSELAPDNQPPSQSAPPTISISSSLTTVETTCDKDGKEMTVTHRRQSVGDDGQVVIEDLPEQPVRVELQIPTMVLRYSRREPKPFSPNRSLAYTGCVNSDTFVGQPPRSWLCLGISGDLDGDAYKVKYEFQLKPDLWDIEAVYNDPDTGAPVLNPVDGQGIKSFRIYREIAFSGLSL
jgi:hypothetical protein